MEKIRNSLMISKVTYLLYFFYIITMSFQTLLVLWNKLLQTFCIKFIQFCNEILKFSLLSTNFDVSRFLRCLKRWYNSYWALNTDYKRDNQNSPANIWTAFLKQTTPLPQFSSLTAAGLLIIFLLDQLMLLRVRESIGISNRFLYMFGP